jgi:N6-adenosine-specific RNA methylase IME4
MSDPFEGLPRGHYGAIYADPPWHFQAWAEYKPLASGGSTRAVQRYYNTMSAQQIRDLPVASMAADDSALFLWVVWPSLAEAFTLIDAWGFEYKTCAFSWMKAHNGQLDMLRDDADVQVGLGYWTRSNSEVCLLATRGNPKRLNADVRQGIIEPRREHSRKPDCVPGRIERLVAGPYLELFSRTTRPGWTCWGNETNKFKPRVYDEDADALGSYNDAVAAIGARVKAGEPVPDFFLSDKT